MEPTSFDPDFRSGWGQWVLDHGPPQPPTRLQRGQSIPVARWVGRLFASVLFYECEYDHGDRDGWFTGALLCYVRRSDEWEEAYRHIDCLDPFTGLFLPPSVGARDAFVCESHSHAVEVEVDGVPLSIMHETIIGMAGADAAVVEVIHENDVMRRRLDSPVGAFVACPEVEEGTEVRVVDGSGHVLCVWT